MRSIALVLVFTAVFSSAAHGAYKQTPHEPLAEGAIAVTKPGNLAKPGATYQLMNDITCERTALFLGPNVTLDLNGYTVTFADGDYEHMPNGGFDGGFEGWDTTKAPNASIITQKHDWPWIGEKVCKLPAGEELVSPWVRLPLADRSYYGMVAMLTSQAKVSVIVEDEKGRPVRHSYTHGEKSYQTSPAEEVASKLDGGVCYAHFRLKPAGKYRLRIRAGDKDLLIDQADIRPALDAGIVARESGWVHSGYTQVAWSGHMPMLVDYLVEGSYNKLIDGVAKATAGSKVTIRNGVVRNGFAGIHSWAILSGGKVHLEMANVKVVSSGINTNAVFGGKMTLSDCRFETETPFIIERHNVINSPVGISGGDGSEVARCEFIGGQGNLAVSGTRGAKIHDNLFVNRQRVTNHYAVHIGGSREIEVYNNRFEPEIGCGVNVYRSKDCDIHDNTFKVESYDRSCELYRGAGTITGVRVSDYNAKKGAERGGWGNKVRDNVFTVAVRQRKLYDNPSGRAVGIFYSSGAGKNYVVNNRFTVTSEGTGGRNMATAFYIGAADHGAVIEDNTIKTQTPAFYIAAGYGPVGDATIRRNTIIKAPGAAEDFKPVRMGYWRLVASDIRLLSNRVEGAPFVIEWGSTDTEGKKHTWSVGWTLTVRAEDADGKPLAGREIVITDKDGKQAARLQTGDDGKAAAELLEYTASRSFGTDAVEEKTFLSPYTVTAGSAKETVTLDENKTVTVRPGGE
jgi:hypothetical protein